MTDRWNDLWSWFEQFGDDSPDMVELVMELEEQFDITIPDEDAAKIHSVAAAKRYLEERRGGN